MLTHYLKKNIKIVVGCIATSLFLVGGAGIIFSNQTEKQAKDVIKFSHKFHVVELEISCVDCHVQAEASENSADNLLSSKDACAECHETETEENCKVCHFDDEETWQALPVKKIIIEFNHKFHISTAELVCVDCHANLDKVDFADKGSMPAKKDCAVCHNNEKASLECSTCHIETNNLRPADHGADFLMAHKNLARIEQDDCIQCHTESDCSECHDPASPIGFDGGGDMIGAHIPSMRLGVKGLILQGVHDLNFRLTHGLEAVGRTKDCIVCHDSQSFCQDCHETQGVDVAGKPLWHGGSNWGAIIGGVGSGGGQHAEMARRDIESCVSCHDTEGADPTCMLCHNDFDGVAGTDPSTHKSSFVDDFGSDSFFHHDDSAVCYACHTNTKKQGVGFCGYCHF